MGTPAAVCCHSSGLQHMPSQPASGIEEPCGLDLAELRKMPDDVLMAHLSSGHDDALAVVFGRYCRLVFKIALKILRDAGEAEDVMLSVFLEIHRAAAQFDPARGTTRVWVLQYAYHRSMNRRQQLVARKFYDTEDISQIQESVISPGYGALAPEETRRLIRQSLDALNSVQRRVLELAYFEGLSMQEIADKTGDSLGNVRHHYYRGLQKLRVFLGDSGKESAGYRR